MCVKKIIDFSPPTISVLITLLILSTYKATGQVPPKIYTDPLLSISNVEELSSLDNHSWETVRLHCAANGDLPMTYSWKKDGVLMPQLEGSNENLTIQLKSAKGIYQCLATNQWGVSKSQSQTVHEIKDETFAFPDLHGSKLWGKLSCPSEGFRGIQWVDLKESLPPTYKFWAVQTVNKFGKHAPRHIVGPDGSLYILHFIKDDFIEDHPLLKYFCVAPLQHYTYKNEPLYITMDTQYLTPPIQVPGLDQWRDFPPVLLFDNSGDVIAFEGEEATLWCIAAGKPIPKVDWTFDSELIANSTMTFVINNVTKSHSGSYQCLISQLGSNSFILKSFHLVVKSRPRFTTRPTDQNVQIGSDFVLNCNGNGEPMPFITWTFNGEELNETKGGHVIRFSVLNNGKSLKIYNFSTDLVGQYGCSIFNEYGSKYAEATVTPASQITATGTSSNFGLYIFLTIATVSIMMALLIMTHFVRKRFHKGNQPQNVYTMVSPNDPSVECNAATLSEGVIVDDLVDEDGYMRPNHVVPRSNLLIRQHIGRVQAVNFPYIGQVGNNERESHIYAEALPDLDDEGAHDHEYDSLHQGRRPNAAYTTLQDIQSKRSK
ncbi:hemolin isoform X3 [Folsomia candida]|uniref:hemolin isoform X3 n=1 Tax=Folsomia candida TaxID=158441 RepID=UPI0016052351|nr:hemolin isoform X3 [Folsomia candida]